MTSLFLRTVLTKEVVGVGDIPQWLEVLLLYMKTSRGDLMLINGHVATSRIKELLWTEAGVAGVGGLRPVGVAVSVHALHDEQGDPGAGGPVGVLVVEISEYVPSHCMLQGRFCWEARMWRPLWPFDDGQGNPIESDHANAGA